MTTNKTSNPNPDRQGVAADLAQFRTTRISFDPRVKVKFGLHIANFTSTEIESAWYTFDEIMMIKHELDDTVRKASLMNFGETHSSMIDENRCLDDCFCTRGLESKMPSTKRDIRLKRHLAKKAVFDEQYRQISSQTSSGKNPDRISKAYGHLSEACQEAAHARARSDYNFSTQVLQDSSVGDHAMNVSMQAHYSRPLFSHT